MDRLKQIDKMFKDLKDNKGIGSFLLFSSNIKYGGVLDAKTKDLILISLAVYSQCELCIAVHIRSAAEDGATKDEILDAATQAVLMGGASKLMYMTVVNEELKNNSLIE